MTSRITPFIASLLVLVFACSDDDEAVNHSGAITLTLNLGGSDIDDDTGQLADERNITTESGNPCAEFLREAEDVLGVEPSAIRVDSVRMNLAEEPRDVDSLDDLWESSVVVSFVVDDERFEVASTTLLESSTEARLSVTATESSLEPIMESLLDCNFAVEGSGQAPGELSDNFDAEVEVTLNLSSLP